MEWEYLPDVSSAYDDKITEINEYIYFLKLLMKPHAHVVYQEPALLYQTRRFNTNYKECNYYLSNTNTSTLRSSAILVIYNFIESISCALMRDIHTHISDCFKTYKSQNINLTLNQLNIQLRNKIILYAKNKGDIEKCIIDYLENTSTTLDTQIISQWITCIHGDPSSNNNQGFKWFNGNVDVKEIRETILPYGINSKFFDELKKKSGRASSIYNIKKGRNELAHGFVTFKDYGNTKSIDEIETDFINVQDFFNGLLDIVNNHLKLYGYLENLDQ